MAIGTIAGHFQKAKQQTAEKIRIHINYLEIEDLKMVEQLVMGLCENHSNEFAEIRTRRIEKQFSLDEKEFDQIPTLKHDKR